jgi:hypothetical protein
MYATYDTDYEREYPDTRDEYGADYLKEGWRDCFDVFLTTFEGGTLGGMNFPAGMKVTLTVDHLHERGNYRQYDIIAILSIGSLGIIVLDFDELEKAMLADEAFVEWCFESDHGSSVFHDYLYETCMDWNDVD